MCVNGENIDFLLDFSPGARGIMRVSTIPAATTQAQS